MALHAVPDPPPDRAALLRQIVELLAQTGPTQPTAVGISLLDGEVELAIKPLDSPDVVRALAGFRAPAAWAAFAVVAPATARRVDGGGPQPVVIGALAARDGFTTSALAGLDPPGADGTGRDDGEGRVLDACRRVLELTTAPPTHGPEWWAAMHWVDAILRAVLAADIGAVPTWSRLRRLDAGGPYACRPWSALRRACAIGRVRIPDLDRAGARWMDDGMFSREALSAYPALTQIVADLRELLPWSTYEAILEVLCDRLDRGRATAHPAGGA
jgi:hypothetical protein